MKLIPALVALPMVALMVPAAAYAQTLPHPTFDQAVISGPGWSPTCPAANCAGSFASPSVVAKQVVNGVTAQSEQAEWLSSFGLYNNTGIGTGAANRGQKVTTYIGQVQGMNAGGGWTLNTDIVRCGATPNGWDGTVGSSTPCNGSQHVDDTSVTIGYELDFSNWDKTAGIGTGPFTVGLYINTLSTYTSTAGIVYNAGSGQVVPSWEDGIYFGPLTANGNTFLDGSGATFGYHLNGVHSAAAIYDESTGSIGLQISGNKTSADLSLSTTSPAGVLVAGSGKIAFKDTSTGSSSLNITGTHTGQDIAVNTASNTALTISGTHATQSFNDTSTAASAINLSGTYSGPAVTTGSSTATYAMAVKAGQKVCLAGLTACAWYDTTAHKWYFSDEDNAVVFSVARTTGNAIFKGTVTPSGTP